MSMTMPCPNWPRQAGDTFKVKFALEDREALREFQRQVSRRCAEIGFEAPVLQKALNAEGQIVLTVTAVTASSLYRQTMDELAPQLAAKLKGATAYARASRHHANRKPRRPGAGRPRRGAAQV